MGKITTFLILISTCLIPTMSSAQTDNPGATVGETSLADSSRLADSTAIAQGEREGSREASRLKWFSLGFLSPLPGMAGALAANPGKPSPAALQTTANQRLFTAGYRSAKKNSRFGSALFGALLGNVVYQGTLSLLWGLAHMDSSPPIPVGLRIAAGTGGVLFFVVPLAHKESLD